MDLGKAMTCAELPGATLYGDAAVAEHRDFATRYEAAVAQFEQDGEPAELWENLRALRFENDEIQWHVDHRGEQMTQGYRQGPVAGCRPGREAERQPGREENPYRSDVPPWAVFIEYLERHGRKASADQLRKHLS